MSAATPEIAITKKLVAGATAALSNVTPQTSTQNTTLPLIVVTRQGGEGFARLSGASRALKQYTIEIASYAATEAAAHALAAQVRALLTPDGAPWRDATVGIQGCFFGDTSEEIVADEAKDTPRVVRETYRVWHTPT